MLEISPKNNTIEFKLEVENTTFNQVESRLVVEVDNNITLIPLTVDKNGVVKGDISLDEKWNGRQGNLKLEIINENNYFTPFKKEVIFSVPVTPKVTLKEVKIPTKINLKELRKEHQDLIKESKTTLSTKDLLDLNSEIDNFFKVK